VIGMDGRTGLSWMIQSEYTREFNRHAIRTVKILQEPGMIFQTRSNSHQTKSVV